MMTISREEDFFRDVFLKRVWMPVSAVLVLCIGIAPAVWSQCTPEILYTFTGEAADNWFGFSVSGAGDVNNDGYADVIVGARMNDAAGINAGRAYVYSGQSGALLYTFTGAAAYDEFGGSVSGAGDVNNDGYADLIVGAHWNDAGGSNAGRAYVYSGQSGAPLYTFTGAAAYIELGASVSGAGDVNNDGYADLIVGTFTGGVGRAYVYSGQSGALLRTLTAEAVGDWFGYSVSGVGDVNKDGYADLIVGAPANTSGGTDAGRAYVYSGQTGTLLYTYTGEAADSYFGNSVSGAGDVNGDGYADFIVAAHSNDAVHTNGGRAYVYSGQTGSLLYTFDGEAAYDNFGVSVSGAGDINKDGYADLIVGAILNDAGGTNAGRAYVYSGQSGGLLYTFEGEAAEDAFGYSVSSAGDVNGDGYADLIVGAVKNDAAGADAGRAYVYACPATYLCGDADGSNTVNILDVAYVISYLYKGGPAPVPSQRADVDHSGAINILDVGYTVNYLYKGGPAPNCP